MEWSLLWIGLVALLTYRIHTSDVHPEPFIPGQPPYLSVPPSVMLQGTRRILEGEATGPESLTVGPDGCIYTGDSKGRILRLDFSKNVTSPAVDVYARVGADLGAACGTEAAESECGRALGMLFLADGSLFVATATHGLLRIHAQSRRVEVVVDKFHGVPLTFLNALAVAEDGALIISQSSQHRERSDWPLALLEARADGRLFRLPPPYRGDQLTEIATGFFFPNGMAFTSTGDLLVIETGSAKVTKLTFDKTTHQLQSRSVLLENLPGVPDNMHSDKDGKRFLMALGVARSRLLDALQPHRRLKRIIGTLLPLKYARHLAPQRGWMIEFDETGRVLNSWEADARIAPMFSDPLPFGDRLLIGSVVNGFLAMAELPNELKTFTPKD